MNENLLFWFVVGCCYLNFKMLANSFVQVYGRFRYNSYKYGEDRMFFRARSTGELPELLMRAEACWRNDLENIPGFILAALCGMFCGVPLEAYRVLIVLFCLGRTMQTVCLLLSLQPWRFIGYFVGQMCTAAMYIWSLRVFLG